MPTTQRLSDVPWSSEGWESEPASRLSVYQRAMAALTVTVLSLGAVAVLAVSQGAGLAGSLKGARGSGGEESVAALTGTELGRPVDPAAGSNGEVPVTIPEKEGESLDFGVAVLAAELPPGAIIEVDGQRLDVPLYAGAELRLPLGTRSVVISADGYLPWRRDVEVDRSGVQLKPELEREGPVALRPTTKPTPRSERLREPPQQLITDLRLLLVQGEQLYQAQRYGEALDFLGQVKTRANDALTQYSGNDALGVIVKEADELLVRVRQECKLMNDPACR